MTNKEFAKTNRNFVEACGKVGLPDHQTIVKHRGMKPAVTNNSGIISLTRQASKWNMKKGRAYKDGR